MADSDGLPDIPMRIPSLDEMAEIESWMLPRDEGGGLHMLREVEVFCGIGPGGARKTRRELIAVMLPNQSHTHIQRRERKRRSEAEAEARTPDRRWNRERE